jgi:ATP-dependent Clp protease ATP-binding subunit ClpC
MQVQVSSELNLIIDEAAEMSRRRGTYYVGVEHLLEALTESDSLLPDFIVDKYAGILRQLVQLCYAQGWRGVPPTQGEVFYSPRCANLISTASRLATKMSHETASAGHLLLAIVTDAYALPSRMLDKQQRLRKSLITDLRKILLQTQPKKETVQPIHENQHVAPKASSVTTSETPQPESPKVEEFTRDLTAMAKAGKFQSAVGREKEAMEMIEVLARQNKNNLILVGEAGTGKTRIVEDLACRCANGQLANLVGQSRILELNLSALMSGTQYRGGVEEKLTALIDELKRDQETILFIDEIHLIMGAGATDGDGMDLANLLKPALGRGEIRCIGATTLKEYRKFISKDPAVDRRFQMVRVNALSPDATRHVLMSMKTELERHHGVYISKKSIDATIALTERYLPNRQFPDKAIDMLDQACASHRISLVMNKNNDVSTGASRRITPHTIRKVVSQAANVPIEDITREERQRIANLDERLSQKIIGQDEAIEKVVMTIKKSKAGLADPNRPDGVMLFSGPTGVGKTQLTKELAKNVFGSSSHLITFDMSEYVEAHSVSKLIGAPPGYVGSEQEGLLTGAVQNSPFSILLFDEIEKAHPQVFDIFLPILDEGRLKDSEGRIIDFKNTIIIFTSNAGAEVLSNKDEGSPDDVIGALKEHFRPEFINRIDEIVPFYPLLFEDVRSILKIMIDEIRGRIRDKQMGIRMFQRAYEHLAQIGYSAEYGARELQRAVERHIANPISERIMDGEFEPGDMIDVLMDNGALTYRKGAERGQSSLPRKAEAV